MVKSTFKAGLPVDKARASKGKRLFDINQVVGKTHKQPLSICSASVKVRNCNCGLGLHADQTDEMVRI